MFFDANEVLEEEEEKEHARDHEESPAFSTRAGKEEEEEEEEEEETWEHRPLRLINALNESDEQELPINDTKGIDVKTSVFVGKILVRCRDVPSREGDKEGKEMTEKYFANKRRTFQTVVQGRFYGKVSSVRKSSPGTNSRAGFEEYRRDGSYRPL